MKKIVVGAIIFLIILLVVVIVRSRRSAKVAEPEPAAPAEPAKPTEPQYRNYFAPEGCPPGWENRGTIGMITKESESASSPLKRGGGFTPGWQWYHGSVCHGDKNKNADGLYKLSAVKEGNAPTVGVLIHNPHVPNSPFKIGDNLNSDWKWAHPYLVPAGTPGGHHVNITGQQTTGLILDKNNRAGNQFPVGGNFNPGWDWIHPALDIDV